MVDRIKTFLGREISGLHEAAYLLAFFAFSSQVLGLARDRLLAGTLGAGIQLDVYYAAFRIPDILFVVVTSFVSISVLVPLFVRQFNSPNTNTQQIVNTIYTVLSISVITIAIVIGIFAKEILDIFVPEIASGPFGPDLVILTRILLLQPIFLSISGLYSSIVQAYKKFFVYALSPLFYNIGIIVGILVFYPHFGLYGLGMGVALGAVLHLLVQCPVVAGSNLTPKLTTNIDVKALKEVLLLSVPRTFALAGNNIIQIIFVALAGSMAIGSISIFTLSYNLQSAPMSIIGVSYSLAAFPTLAKFFSEGKIQEFTAELVRAARHIIFWTLPLMVLFIVLRAQIVRTLLGAGEFDWNSTRLTAAALAFFSLSIVAQSLILLFVRGYYSAGQTKKPLYVTAFTSVVTIALAYYLTHIYETSLTFHYFIERLLRVEGLEGTNVLMLPLAFSIGTILNMLILWVMFENDFKTFSKTLWRSIFHGVGASLIMGYVTFLALKYFSTLFDLDTFFGIFGQGLFAGLTGIIAGTIVLVLLDNNEIKIVWKTIHHKFWRAKIIVAETDETT